MSKERPILFSTPMVQAILEGRKSLTRRECKNEHVLFMLNKNGVIPSYFNGYQHGFCPYGIVGDRLWVRETFAVHEIEGKECIYFKADIPNKTWDGDWKPSIFMPRKVCRILLEITGVRVERLRDISEQDAIAEGIEKIAGEHDPFAYRSYHVKPGKEQLIPCAPFVSFRTLWQSINGYPSWDANPWVWVISFKKV